jgi:hypothetical protein
VQPRITGGVDRLNKAAKRRTDAVSARNFAKRINSLGGKAPCEATAEAWTKHATGFNSAMDQLTSGQRTPGVNFSPHDQKVLQKSVTFPS